MSKDKTLIIKYRQGGSILTTEVKILKDKFKLFWHAWECDGYAYVVELKGKPIIVHGSQDTNMCPLDTVDAQENLQDILQGATDLQDALNLVNSK